MVQSTQSRAFPMFTAEKNNHIPSKIVYLLFVNLK